MDGCRCIRGSWVYEFEFRLTGNYGEEGEYAVYHDQYVPPIFPILFTHPHAHIVVLTTTWCELMTDSNLFRFGYYPSRDHKIAAIFLLFFGGFVGRSLLFQIGSAATLGVGTGLRLLIAASWYFVPGKL